MRRFLLAVLFVAVVRPGLGQDVTPVASRSDSAKAKNDGVSSKPSLPQADHVQIAAEDLEAAGLDEQAQRIPKKAVDGQARLTTASIPQIIVSLRMLELSKTKLSKRSSQRYGGSKDMSAWDLLVSLKAAPIAGAEVPDISFKDPKLPSLIEALRKMASYECCRNRI